MIGSVNPEILHLGGGHEGATKLDALEHDGSEPGTGGIDSRRVHSGARSQ
jgi:hypothetical protein